MDVNTARGHLQSRREKFTTPEANWETLLARAEEPAALPGATESLDAINRRGPFVLCFTKFPIVGICRPVSFPAIRRVSACLQSRAFLVDRAKLSLASITVLPLPSDMIADLRWLQGWARWREQCCAVRDKLRGAIPATTKLREGGGEDRR